MVFFLIVKFLDDGVRRVLTSEDIKDFNPRHSKEFNNELEYQAKWQKSDIHSDGFWPAKILCMAGNMKDLESAAKKQNIKPLPPNFEEMYAVNKKSSGKKPSMKVPKKRPTRSRAPEKSMLEERKARMIRSVKELDKSKKVDDLLQEEPNHDPCDEQTEVVDRFELEERKAKMMRSVKGLEKPRQDHVHLEKNVVTLKETDLKSCDQQKVIENFELDDHRDKTDVEHKEQRTENSSQNNSRDEHASSHYAFTGIEDGGELDSTKSVKSNSDDSSLEDDFQDSGSEDDTGKLLDKITSLKKQNAAKVKALVSAKSAVDNALRNSERLRMESKAEIKELKQLVEQSQKEITLVNDKVLELTRNNLCLQNMLFSKQNQDEGNPKVIRNLFEANVPVGSSKRKHSRFNSSHFEIDNLSDSGFPDTPKRKSPIKVEHSQMTFTTSTPSNLDNESRFGQHSTPKKFDNERSFDSEIFGFENKSPQRVPPQKSINKTSPVKFKSQSPSPSKGKECMSLEEVCERFKKDLLKQEPFVPDSNGKFYAGNSVYIHAKMWNKKVKNVDKDSYFVKRLAQCAWGQQGCAARYVRGISKRNTDSLKTKQVATPAKIDVVLGAYKARLDLQQRSEAEILSKLDKAKEWIDEKFYDESRPPKKADGTPKKKKGTQIIH